MQVLGAAFRNDVLERFHPKGLLLLYSDSERADHGEENPFASEYCYPTFQEAGRPIENLSRHVVANQTRGPRSQIPAQPIGECVRPHQRSTTWFLLCVFVYSEQQDCRSLVGKDSDGPVGDVDAGAKEADNVGIGVLHNSVEEVDDTAGATPEEVSSTIVATISSGMKVVIGYGSFTHKELGNGPSAKQPFPPNKDSLLHKGSHSRGFDQFIAVCREGSSSGNQQVTSSTPPATPMGTVSADDNDVTVNDKVGMSAVQLVCAEDTLARCSCEVDKLQNKRASALNTDEHTTPATQKSKLDIEDAEGSEADHKDCIDDDYGDSDSVEYDDYSLDIPKHFPNEFPSASDAKKAEDIEYTDDMFTEDPNKPIDRLKYCLISNNGMPLKPIWTPLHICIDVVFCICDVFGHSRCNGSYDSAIEFFGSAIDFFGRVRGVGVIGWRPSDKTANSNWCQPSAGDGTNHTRLPSKADRVHSPAGPPDFRKWESCRKMKLVGGFSRGYPVFPAPSFRRRPIFTSVTLTGSQDLAVKSRPDLLTHSFETEQCRNYDAWETGDPLENPPTSGNVRRSRPGIELGSPWWEASNRPTAQPTRPLNITDLREISGFFSFRVSVHRYTQHNENAVCKLRAMRVTAITHLMRVAGSPLSLARFYNSDVEKNARLEEAFQGNTSCRITRELNVTLPRDISMKGTVRTCRSVQVAQFCPQPPGQCYCSMTLVTIQQRLDKFHATSH
ncbi:hypothetical protein PR048_014004 [Dryococelus australis]|uniref:Uncharacterized protein n=1 Tax=Dryococelus australis TaxID=614101 RepID=A0ABQ9HTW8_9NEOP|nr:hypothetical protein PR048_014004 [Dryococelus australis]